MSMVKENYSKTTVYLVSACLLGLKTRYDDQEKVSRKCLTFLKGKTFIPVCPEQLGGLPTPRDPARLVGGNGEMVINGRAKVLTCQNIDVSNQFIIGANQVTVIAKLFDIVVLCLKARSPSCSVSEPMGVTAALLNGLGYELIEFD